MMRFVFYHRYVGTDCAIMTEVTVSGGDNCETLPDDAIIAALPAAKEAFLTRYRTEFGFELGDRCVHTSFRLPADVVTGCFSTRFPTWVQGHRC